MHKSDRLFISPSFFTNCLFTYISTHEKIKSLRGLRRLVILFDCFVVHAFTKILQTYSVMHNCFAFVYIIIIHPL